MRASLAGVQVCSAVERATLLSRYATEWRNTYRMRQLIKLCTSLKVLLGCLAALVLWCFLLWCWLPWCFGAFCFGADCLGAARLLQNMEMRPLQEQLIALQQQRDALSAICSEASSRARRGAWLRVGGTWLSSSVKSLVGIWKHRAQAELAAGAACCALAETDSCLQQELPPRDCWSVR